MRLQRHCVSASMAHWCDIMIPEDDDISFFALSSNRRRLLYLYMVCVVLISLLVRNDVAARANGVSTPSVIVLVIILSIPCGIVSSVCAVTILFKRSGDGSKVLAGCTLALALVHWWAITLFAF